MKYQKHTKKRNELFNPKNKGKISSKSRHFEITFLLSFKLKSIVSQFSNSSKMVARRQTLDSQKPLFEQWDLFYSQDSHQHQTNIKPFFSHRFHLPVQIQ